MSGYMDTEPLEPVPPGHCEGEGYADLREPESEESTPELLDPEGSGYVPEPPWDAPCPVCRGTGGGVYNDCAACDGNGVAA